MSSKPCAEVVQKLIDARTSALEEAFATTDLAKVMSWQSRDVRYDDVGKCLDFATFDRTSTEGRLALAKFGMDYNALEDMFRESFGIMSSLRVVSSTTTGATPEFVTWEMYLEVLYSKDEPALGLVAGQVTTLKGVGLQWWRWEGEGDQWRGELSEQGIRGWKIVKENDYFIPTKE